MTNYIPYWVYGKYTRIRLPFEVMVIGFALTPIHPQVPCAASSATAIAGHLLAMSTLVLLLIPQKLWGSRAASFAQHPRARGWAIGMLIALFIAHALLTH